MSQGSKSAYYKAVKAGGVELDKHYREYTTAELQSLAEAHGIDVDVPPAPSPTPARPDDVAELRQQLSGLGDVIAKLAAIVVQQQAAPQPQQEQPKFPPPAAEYSSTGPLAEPPKPAVKPAPAGLDPMQHAGVTLNTHAPDEPIRIDEHGNQWFQNEVNKPGYAKPRGRRIYRDVETGTTTETIKVGNYTETFEIPGDPSHTRPVEVKITLPSYQTGIYKAPGMPFKIHTYQGNRGFDWDDVNRFYGAADLVPDTIKRVYVSSDLCYDIQTTIRAINDEFRERVLKKETLR